MDLRRNIHIDFMDFLQFDIIMRIMSFLDDPADIIRASVVSRAWHDFVINNSLLRKLSIKNAPAISIIDSVIEQVSGASTIIDYRSEHPLSFELLKKDHIVHSDLLRALSKSSITPQDVIECVLGASTTQFYPEDSVVNLVLLRNQYAWGTSYWTSRGCTDPNVPEKILFKLFGDVCIVTDIQIRPAPRSDQRIYSANSVRFRMGHPKSRDDLMPSVQSLPLQEIDDDKYVWTYTSPEFPMLQEASLQSFHLPEPALCIGGYFQIELLGKARKDEVNEVYYICLGHVKIKGHTLVPAFDVEMGLNGSISISYQPTAVEDALDYLPYDDESDDDQAVINQLNAEDKPVLLVQVENLIQLRRFH